MKTVITFIFEDDKEPFLLDITSLMYDLELIHDLSVLLAYKEYSEFKFSRFFWNRSGRPLKSEHRLRALRIIKDSPLTLEVIVAAIGGLWILVQAFEKVGNWKLNREKLRLEVRKLHHECNIKEIEERSAREELEKHIQSREASYILNQLIKRLESNPLLLTDLNFEIYGKSEIKIKCSKCNYEVLMREEESRTCPRCGAIVVGPKAKL